jgi:predicted  nucleic acid-binding Zn-ribbon protein
MGLFGWFRDSQSTQSDRLEEIEPQLQEARQERLEIKRKLTELLDWFKSWEPFDPARLEKPIHDIREYLFEDAKIERSRFESAVLEKLSEIAESHQQFARETQLKLAQEEQAIAQLQQQLQTLPQQVRDSIEIPPQPRRELSELDGKLSQLDEKISGVDCRILDLPQPPTQELSNIFQHIADLDRKVAGVNRQLRDLPPPPTQELSDISQHISQLGSQIEGVQQSFEQLRDRVDSQLSQIQTQQSTLQSDLEPILHENRAILQLATPSTSQISSIDWKRLNHLLESGRWKDADFETRLLLFEMAGLHPGDTFDSERISHLSCRDLQILDRLWRNNSNQRFGLSVQKQLFEDIGGRIGTDDYNTYCRFGQKVGWLVGDRWLPDADLHFSSDALPGYLPVTYGLHWIRGIRSRKLYFVDFLSRLETCL